MTRRARFAPRAAATDNFFLMPQASMSPVLNCCRVLGLFIPVQFIRQGLALGTLEQSLTTGLGGMPADRFPVRMS